MNKHDTVIGYIEYLDSSGCAQKRIPYVDAEKFKTRIYASFVNVRQRCLGFQQSAHLCRTQRSIFKSDEDILTGAVLIRVVQNFFGRLCKQPRAVFVLLLLHFVVQLSDKGIVFHIASPSALCRILSQKFRFSGSVRLR